MLSKLKETEKRYASIEEELAKPETVADVEKYTKLIKEYKSLTPVVEKYREYESTRRGAEDAKELMASEEDPEMRAMAEEEYYTLRDKLPVIEEELKVLLLP
ncbi:MAG: PCRF domain-containing protein, partial [Clostridia bacterium]|nr:PCRF domain-containing protein [Clostridia bacterium]